MSIAKANLSVLCRMYHSHRAKALYKGTSSHYEELTLRGVEDDMASCKPEAQCENKQPMPHLKGSQARAAPCYQRA